jgi:predicted GTPase
MVTVPDWAVVRFCSAKMSYARVSEPMITKIQIQNFRSLRDVSVAKLRRLNIVTGRNAGGKTSLLEAVFLNAGAANASLLFSINTFRGDREAHA